ncbi:MAG: hypothetical protein J2P26_00570 [Nocardiopsaceae bacterium]|nr:hypothetical protein [Nocardiopsaceae bacterium]
MTIWDGFWTAMGRGCGCPGPCSCRPDCAVELPGPVIDILEVRVGGAPVATTAYRVMGNLLMRVDGGCWPDCQDLAAPASAPGSFQVTYRRGEPVPYGGQVAAAALANEIWKACTGSGKCRLPDRVQQLTREGVSMTMIDDMEWLNAGRTGLAEVDSWLAAVNPAGLKSRPQVWTPDLPRHRG